MKRPLSSFATAVVLLYATSGFVVSAEPRRESAVTQVRLPEGIYVFRPSIKRNEFSPLFIVEGGKLVDANVLLGKTEKGDPTARRYIKEPLVVFEGSRKVAELAIESFEPVDSCFSAQFVPDPRTKGILRAPDLKVLEQEFRHKANPLASTRLLGGPAGYGDAKKTDYWLLPERKERERVASNVQQALVPALQPEIKEVIKKSFRREVSGEGYTRLLMLESADIDNNGRPDFIGVLQFNAKYGTHRAAALPIDIAFVVLDTGKVEKLAHEFGSPMYVISAVVDVDQDGTQEIVLQKGLEANRRGGSPGRQVIVLRRNDSTWRPIFQSRRICDGSFFGDNLERGE
jgi:hypothetical protein